MVAAEVDGGAVTEPDKAAGVAKRLRRCFFNLPERAGAFKA